MSGTSGSSNIYSTNIAGLGIRVSMYSSQPYWGFPTDKTAAPFTDSLSGAQSGQTGAFTSSYFHVVVELIKTGDSVSAGSLNYSVSNFTTAQGTNLLPLSDLMVSGNISVSSCSVDSSTPQTVLLNTWYTNALLNKGDTAQPKAFNIILNCSGNSNVNITFNGQEDTDAPGLGVLALDSSSTAKGVGIQVLYNDDPISLNQTMPIGPATAGQFQIPFIARYYKTQDTITVGDVSALVTYTLTYL